MLLFSQLIPYLTDPIILIGLVLFLGFLMIRYLIKSKRISQLPAKWEADIPKLILNNGFILGLLLMVVGVGLKHSERQQAEEKNALTQLKTEYDQNLATIMQLSENTRSLWESHLAVSSSLRSSDSKILSIMFPKDNGEGAAGEDEPRISKLVDASFDELKESALLKNDSQMAAYNEAKEKMKANINRYYTELKSMQDIDGTTYVINEDMLQIHIEIIENIDGFDMLAYENTLMVMDDLRSQYDLVLRQAEDYISETKNFIERNTYIGNGDVYEILTKERLSHKSLSDFSAVLKTQLVTLKQMKFDL